jgi:hypothetical protein
MGTVEGVQQQNSKTANRQTGKPAKEDQVLVSEGTGSYPETRHSGLGRMMQFSSLEHMRTGWGAGHLGV